MNAPIRYNILLVEDSATQAARMEGELEAQGWEVRRVPSAEDAMKILATFVPDLILVDYHLPGMQGDELCRQVRMRIDTRVIAVIMLTADEDREVERRGLESGADDFIRKTAEPSILVLRIRTLLRRVRTQKSILNVADTQIRQARILALDDSPTYLEHLKSELRHEAFEVHATTDSAAAIDLICRHDYDCVLIDIVMPQADGVEISRRIDELRRRGAIHSMILMLTAQDHSNDLTRALEAGADDFVSKSSDTTVLKVRIRALLRRKYYEEENSRILAELKDKQLQIERSRMEKQAAEARAALVEELERTAQSLRSTNADLERFAHIAAHDLQEPLRTVASYLQLVERNTSGQLCEQDRRYVQFAVDGAKRLKALISDLLTFSSIHVQGGPFVQTDLNELLSTIVTEAQLASADYDAPIIHVGPLPSLCVDRHQLAHLFRSIVQNALTFRSAKTPQIRIAASDAGNEWHFVIEDNGIGVASEFAEEVFVLFRRLHTQDSYPGTGAGLAICKRIVERHHGHIWIEPSSLGGTAVHFTIPANVGRNEEECSRAA